MSTFVLHADFKAIDGGETTTREVLIRANVVVTTADGTIYEGAPIPVDDGELSVPLPANDNPPFDFGFIVSRKLGSTTQVWHVPTQPPGETVELSTYTESAALPMPVLVRGAPGGLAGLDADGDVIDADGNKVINDALDPRFPEDTVLPLRADWQPEWFWFLLRDPVTGERQPYDKGGLPA